MNEAVTGASAWQALCAQCKHLLRSGDAGDVWHCAVVRAGGRPVYAVTARAEPLRKTHPSRGKCGRDAKLFERQGDKIRPVR